MWLATCGRVLLTVRRPYAVCSPCLHRASWLYCLLHSLHGGCSSVGRATDCGSVGRGFEPLRPPQRFITRPLAGLVCVCRDMFGWRTDGGDRAPFRRTAHRLRSERHADDTPPRACSSSPPREGTWGPGRLPYGLAGGRSQTALIFYWTNSPSVILCFRAVSSAGRAGDS